jgi:Rps23 Pro-64 3,4-dihydroxylase Tpa1-like proline 4-hydroxylase
MEFNNNIFDQNKKDQKTLKLNNGSNEFYKDQCFVYDDKLTRAQLNHLHRYCIQSKYKFIHTSDPLFPSRDLRFTSHLSPEELEDTYILPSIQEISNDLDQTLYLYNFYINHYPQMSYSNRHTDSSFSGCLTILIFCNKYWDETWGGELKIYRENSSVHQVIDFIPGRILVFDSQIEHKVMPLTPFAQSDRFTLAIKAFNDPQNVSKMDKSLMIEVAKQEELK